MRDTYIGLFTVVATENWHVSFPDLPGCDAWGRSFKEIFDAHAGRWLIASITRTRLLRERGQR